MTAVASRVAHAEVVPNVVMIGAPKCGTSSMFRWLAEHPQVCTSSVKEPGFLLDRGHPLFVPERNVHDHGLAAYSAYFEHCLAEPGALVRLEATTHYLYSDTARDVLSRLDPQPHIIVMIRRPADRVRSSFRYTKNNLGVLRDDVDLARYVRAAELPVDELTDPDWGGRVEIWRKDVEYSRYADYLRRWAEVFPAERLHVLLFERMTADPRAFMIDVAQRIGIDAAFFRDFEFDRHNETYNVRNTAIHRLARGVNRFLPRNRLRQAMRGAYFRLFTTRATRSSRTEEDVMRELDTAFEPWNARLAEEFRIDLSAWTRKGRSG